MPINKKYDKICNEIKKIISYKVKEVKVMQNIEEIYKQHSKTVYKYLFCLTHSEDISEDLTQETFAIAVKEIKKFKGNCKISVWLCQIAKHLWYKKLKNISYQPNVF